MTDLICFVSFVSILLTCVASLAYRRLTQGRRPSREALAAYFRERGLLETPENRTKED